MVVSENRIICIVDTSLLLFGTLILRDDIRYVTSPKVYSEVYKNRLKREVLNVYITTKRLEVEDPEEEFLEEVLNIAGKIGELEKLSPADIDILALAIKYSRENKVVVFTDDYSIQNILENLGIDYIPIRRKIKYRVRRWRYTCLKCGEKFLSNIRICPVCGGNIARSRYMS
ncbi:MAG TPA: hypothetical protein EYH44_00895 [Thermoprotei archaeon]|nr:hypothetical protein [Thermoprotei archaeon]